MSEPLTRSDLNVILEKIIGLGDKISALEQDILAVQCVINAKGHDTPCKALAVLGTKKDALCVEVAELKSDIKVEFAKLVKAMESVDNRVSTLASQNSVSFDGFANRQDQLRADINKDMRKLEARCNVNIEDAKARSRKKHDVLLMRLTMWEVRAKTAYVIIGGALSALAWWVSR